MNDNRQKNENKHYFLNICKGFTKEDHEFTKLERQQTLKNNCCTKIWVKIS